MALVTPQDLYLLTVIALVWLARRSGSLRLERLLVEVIATVAHRLMVERRLTAHAAVRRALGADADRATVRRIVKSGYRATWTEVFATLPRRDTVVLEHADVQRLDVLQDAQRAGNAVLLWESSLFGSRSLGKQALARLGVSVTQLHYQGHMEGFDYDRQGGLSLVFANAVLPFFAASQRRVVREVITIPASGSLDYLRACQQRLRTGHVVCVAADGGVGARKIDLPFLGTTHAFSSGLVSLARISDATVVPYFSFMDRGRLRLRFEAPIRIERGEEGAERSLREYAAVLESYVRRYPDQYRGWYVMGHLHEGRGVAQGGPRAARPRPDAQGRMSPSHRDAGVNTLARRRPNDR